MPTVPMIWIRNPCDRLAIEQGCYFDAAAGEYVIEFLETFCRLKEGRWQGELLEVFPWQRDFLMRLYGWKRKDGYRRFRTAFLQVSKKNGKSPLIAGLSLYHTGFDDEPGANVFLN